MVLLYHLLNTRPRRCRHCTWSRVCLERGDYSGILVVYGAITWLGQAVVHIGCDKDQLCRLPQITGTIRVYTLNFNIFPRQNCKMIPLVCIFSGLWLKPRNFWIHSHFEQVSLWNWSLKNLKCLFYPFNLFFLLF